MKSRTATELGPTSTIRLALLCLPAVMVLLGGSGALNAVDYYWNWNNGNTHWGTAGNWSPSGGPPGVNDRAFFNTPGLNSSNQSITLQIDAAASTLTFDSSGTTQITGSGGNRTLTLGSGGIVVNSGAGAVTIGSTASNSAAILSFATGVTSQTWTNNSGSMLTAVNGVTSTVAGSTLTVTGTGNTTIAGITVSGAGSLSLVKDGSGTLSVSGASNYAGTTTINTNGGTLEISGATGSLASTSSITVNQGGTLLLNGSGGLAQNQISNSAAIILTNGTISFGTSSNLDEQVGGMLSLTGTSILDFGAISGGQILRFGTITSWGASDFLTVYNYTGGQDALFFGSTLTQQQLDNISFYDGGVGSNFLGTGTTGPGAGQVSPVPEPSTLLAGLALVGLVAYRERRWFLRCRGARVESLPLPA